MTDRSKSRRHRDAGRERSRSPRRDDSIRNRFPREDRQPRLPFSAKHLDKHDLSRYRPLFASYLFAQKQLVIEKLDEGEVKGRWKSFVGKWNRGELLETYYDPGTLRHADTHRQGGTAKTERTVQQDRSGNISSGGSDADELGPALPPSTTRGVTQPSRQDLSLRDEMIDEQRFLDGEQRRKDRKGERKIVKERLEELVPRAEAGTKERQLEKKREKAAADKTFRERNSPGAEEMKEGDLFGDDGVDSYKAKLKMDEKKKSEREIRKEEILRTRAVERESRLAEHRTKEDETMKMLKAIAVQRFG